MALYVAGVIVTFLKSVGMSLRAVWPVAASGRHGA